ncbi:GNAT family N-acetyltransferase [Sphaerospermopsis torques-reginae]|uniref:GNAT family N-acetyltransferase n=1 Tax=Sphaerospermopsis torques-reginae ITEP-024 TaxID=984208 RepID=A0ABX8WY08_9CYAN|nr:GNAT family N-acetyltransferase [Sphaerospermopsis torques-reginae]QYX31296.1 GNAT family N-acetyltransferase [Sphaerospermopsis torques-reginae ITEP-024]
MKEIKAPQGIEIKRNYETEKKNEVIDKRKYFCYDIYYQNLHIGASFYKMKQDPEMHWYIETFFINEYYREKGYGSYLLKYLCNMMWSEKSLPIIIYPAPVNCKKEDFIDWFTKRGFVENHDILPGKIYYSLYPQCFI